MPDTGWLSPGTVVDNAAYGTVAWTNPGNAAASDDARAEAVLVGNSSHYLKATNFGAVIPAGATPDGMEMRVERSVVSGTGLTDDRIRAVKVGTVQTTDKATATDWPTTDAYVTYGGPTDKWGTTWTEAEVEDPTSGIVIACDSPVTRTARIDHVQMKWHYTGGADESSFMGAIPI